MVFIHSNGQIVKVATCKAKPYELKEREVNREENNTVKNKDGNYILDKDERIEDKDAEMEDRQVMIEDGLRDIIGAKYLKIDESVCFLENSIYVVELPVREHGKPEVIKAKNNEIKNLETYETFEEIDDEGQRRIGSRWIVT